MTRTTLVVAIGGIALLAGNVAAQTTYGPQIRQPASVSSTSLNLNYDSYYAEDATAKTDAAATEALDGCCNDSCCNDPCAGDCDSCCDSCCNDCCGCAPWALFAFADDNPWYINGWVNGGYTWNPDSPANNFNGPQTFNFRSNEFLMDQLYAIVGRSADNDGYGLAFGGQVDMLYGTDYRFTQALGLETEGIDGTQKWNSDNGPGGAGMYGFALPQAYLEVAVDDLSIKFGHFYTIIGYEVVPATGNFFYSHAYTMQYGEPFTHTGMLASYALNDVISLTGGLTRGWDTWEDNNNDLGFLGGVTIDGGLGVSLAWAMHTSEEDNAGIANTYINSWVVSVDDLLGFVQYVGQHDLGVTDNELGAQDAHWYGFNQYWFVPLTDATRVGARLEWFRDEDGARVVNAAGQGGFRGHFNGFTAGINTQWNPNVVIRSEMRWDQYDGAANANGQLPYDDGFDSNQYTWGTDAIMTY